MISILRGLPFIAWIFSQCMKFMRDQKVDFMHEACLLGVGAFLDSCSWIDFPVMGIIHLGVKCWNDEPNFSTKSMSMKAMTLFRHSNLLCMGWCLNGGIWLFPVPKNKKLGTDIDGNITPYEQEEYLTYCHYIKNDQQKQLVNDLRAYRRQPIQTSMWHSVYERILQSACENQVSMVAENGYIFCLIMAICFPLSCWNSTTSYFVIHIYVIMAFLYNVRQDDEKMWMWVMPVNEVDFVRHMLCILALLSTCCYNHKHFWKGIGHNYLFYVIIAHQLVWPTFVECDWVLPIMFIAFPILQIYSSKMFDWLGRQFDDSNISRCTFYVLWGSYFPPYLLALGVYIYNSICMSAEEEKRMKQSWKYYFRNNVFATKSWIDFLNTITSDAFGFTFNIILPRMAHDMYDPVARVWGTFGKCTETLVTLMINVLGDCAWALGLSLKTGSISITVILFIVIISFCLIIGVITFIAWHKKNAIGSGVGNILYSIGGFLGGCADHIKDILGLVKEKIKQEQEMARLLLETQIKWTDDEEDILRQMPASYQREHFKTFLESRLHRGENLNDANKSSLNKAIEMLHIGKDFCMETFRTVMNQKDPKGTSSNPNSSLNRLTGQPTHPQAPNGSKARAKSPGGAGNRARAGGAGGAGMGLVQQSQAMNFEIIADKVEKMDTNTMAKTPLSRYDGMSTNQKLCLSHKDYKNNAGYKSVMEAFVYVKNTQNKAGGNFNSQGSKGAVFTTNQDCTYTLANKIWILNYNPQTSIMTITMPDKTQTFSPIFNAVNTMIR